LLINDFDITADTVLLLILREHKRRATSLIIKDIFHYSLADYIGDFTSYNYARRKCKGWLCIL